jgi:hypothetical protein
MIKFAIYYAIFTIVYVILILLTLPLFVSWGEQRNIVERAYVFFLTSPIDSTKSLALILVNSLFWFVILFAIAFLIGRLVSKRGKGTKPDRLV